MARSPDDKTPKPPAKPDRLAREAAALRANLLKRKDQARKREVAKKKPEGER
ncbi:MAG: hypothetical protein U1E70_02870 [Acetobacteraceae bacterium]|nr:hypothetical protein [Pseudomonadota bacterium]